MTTRNTTRYRKSIEETIEAEDKQRFKWYQQFTGLNLQKPGKRSFTKNFVFEMMLNQADTERYRFRLPTVAKPPQPQDFKPEIDEYLTRIGAKNQDGTYSTVFTIPPTDQVKSLLSYGVSHDSNGRADFLRERYKMKPEEKYKFPISTSMSYGWRLGDPNNTKIPQRVPIFLAREVEGSFFRHNGVLTENADGPIKTRGTNAIFDGLK
jgi:hypothetical protein